MNGKPFAESCAQNQQPIFEVLQTLFIEQGTVLEIGSGTGQHAVFFTQRMSHLQWQPTDLADQITGMKLWFDEVEHDRILQPRVIDVEQDDWSMDPVEYVFSANTAHIVSWPQLVSMLAGVAKQLKPGGLFAQYGPFNYGGQYTSDSNARFDVWLKDRDPNSGIRNFEDLQLIAKTQDMVLFNDFAMPANNRILVWQKSD